MREKSVFRTKTLSDKIVNVFKFFIFLIIKIYSIFCITIGSLYVWHYVKPDRMAKSMYNMVQPLQDSEFQLIRKIAQIPTGIVTSIERTWGSYELTLMQEKLNKLSTYSQLEGLENGIPWIRYSVEEPINKYGQLYTFEEFKKLSNKTLSIPDQLQKFDKVSSQYYSDFISNKKKMQQIYNTEAIKWEEEYFNQLNDKNKLLTKQTISRYSNRFKGSNKIYIEDNKTNNMVLWIVVNSLNITVSKDSLIPIKRDIKE